MDAFVTSLLIAALLIVIALLAGVAPSLRHAIRQSAPQLEESYFSPSPGRRLQFGGLRILATLSTPRAELAQSAEFRASLRLVRVLVLAGATFATALLVVVFVT